MTSYKYIKLNKNTKKPIKGEHFKDTKDIKQIDINFYNIGLMAGVNNLVMFDVDIKDGGLIEWNEYLKENFEPYTMKQQTPSGGYHYIFLHHDPTYTEEENQAIDRLENTSKYRKKGLDVRKNNGYIVFEPSTINNKPYKLLNDIQPQKMPLKLVLWLLEFESKEKEAINNNLVLIEDVNELKVLLDKFNNVLSRQWFNITTAIKNLIHPYNNLDTDEIKLIWKKWSKQQTGYNKENNVKIWDGITSNINMNFIISQYNKKQAKEDQIELLESFKQLEPLKKPDDIPHLKMNNKYIFDEQYESDQFNKEIFNKYDTIIIKSTTGTGKTSNTARHVETYFKDNNEYKFMSIVNLKTLSHQHIESFKNINIMSYEDKTALNKEDDNIVICLNSLMMYSKYDGDFFKNYIVYIDEITSLISSLTHNETLNKALKGVYIVLMKIIKNAHKVIVSDATINNNTFTFLEKRTNKIYIENTYKKYENIPVYKMNNENEFLNIMKKHVKKNNYFLFGSDSVEISEKYYIDTIPEDKKMNSILINSKNKFIITDASEQLKNKFVFYSPSITTGVDFSIDTPQDVFIYINGRSIDPAGSFQQLSRTRNIKNVYVYISEMESKPAKFNTLDEVKEHIKTISKTDNSNINKMCFSVDDENEYIFNENAYFNLFTFNEYIKDTYETNKKQHFYNILNDNGFNIELIGTVEKLNNKKKKEMKDKKIEVDEQNFETQIKQINTDEEDAKNEENVLKLTMKYLNIDNEEKAREYKDILIDKFKRDDYFNLIKLLRPENKILYKTKEASKQTTNYKNIYTSYYKVSLIWQLEKEMKINRFEFDKLEDDKPFKISDELIKNINVSFRCSIYPTTYNEFIEYYVNKISHMTGNIKIVSSVKKQINKKRQQVYNIDKDILNKYVELYKLTDERRKNLIECPYFNKLEATKEPIKETNNNDNNDNIDFIEDIEIKFNSPFYMSYPAGCVEFTMNDKELLRIGWNKNQIQEFNIYKKTR